jgi:hypothetical protein
MNREKNWITVKAPHFMSLMFLLSGLSAFPF